MWTDVAAPQTTSHNYTISWTAGATTWYIDDVAVRTLKYADALAGENYPQTPMNVRVGIWAGGDSGNDEGTIEWAGGETVYDQGPFTMYLEKIEVVNENPGRNYTYGDMSGDWESIVVNGEGEDADEESASSSKTAMSSLSSRTTAAGTAGTTATATVTQTGVYWTATASASASASTSASIEQALTNRASTLSLDVWEYGVLGLLALVAIIR